jgi:hypothetical protein
MTMSLHDGRRRVRSLLTEIIREVEALGIIAEHHGEGHELLVDFSIGPVSEQKVKNESNIMTVTITDIQQVPVSISVTDERGNPGTVIAPPAWAVSDANLLTVAPAADGMSAVVAAKGPLGNGQVTVSGDGGPNPGDDPFTSILDVAVVGSRATAVVFSTGTATTQTGL